MVSQSMACGSSYALSSYALLADGTTIEIRQSRLGDFEAVRCFNEAMSADNFYLRFFGVSKRAAQQDARRICRPPDADHAALLAWLGPRLAAVAAPSSSSASCKIPSSGRWWSSALAGSPPKPSATTRPGSRH